MYSGSNWKKVALLGLFLTVLVALAMRPLDLLPDFSAKAAAATVLDAPESADESEALVLAREAVMRARSTSALPAGAVDMQVFLADFSFMQTTVNAWLDVGNHRDIEVVSWTQTVVRSATTGKDQLLGTLVYRKKTEKKSDK
jgi:hypothetical protein